MLAKDLVGWDVIEQYDEMLLANDSCYLVQSFDQVFDRDGSLRHGGLVGAAGDVRAVHDSRRTSGRAARSPSTASRT